MTNKEDDGLKGKFAAADAGKSSFHSSDAVGAVHRRDKEQVDKDLARERISNMSGSDSSTRMERVAVKGRESAKDSLQRRAKRQFNDQIFFAMLQQDIARLQERIANIEDGLRERYGENFAEVIAEKYLDVETSQRLSGESDEDYWNRIALEIQRRIEAGEIDPDDPLIRQWARTRNELYEKQEKRRAQIIENAEELEAKGTLQGQRYDDLIAVEDQVSEDASAVIQETYQDSRIVTEGQSAASLFASYGAELTAAPVSDELPSEPVLDTPKIV